MRINITVKKEWQSTLEKYEKNIEKGLMACGLTAERYAKKDCPVDTGRLKGSITFATGTYQSNAQGATNPPEPPRQGDYRKKSEPAPKTMVLGTNVHYASKIELTDVEHRVGRAHFMRDALATNVEDYANLLTKALNS